MVPRRVLLHEAMPLLPLPLHGIPVLDATSFMHPQQTSSTISHPKALQDHAFFSRSEQREMHPFLSDGSDLLSVSHEKGDPSSRTSRRSWASSITCAGTNVLESHRSRLFPFPLPIPKRSKHPRRWNDQTQASSYPWPSVQGRVGPVPKVRPMVHPSQPSEPHVIDRWDGSIRTSRTHRSHPIPCRFAFPFFMDCFRPSHHRNPIASTRNLEVRLVFVFPSGGARGMGHEPSFTVGWE